MTIDKNIPIPTTGAGRPINILLTKWKKGDSFHAHEPQSRISAASRMFVKRNKPKWKFKTKQENNGTRVWRIK